MRNRWIGGAALVATTLGAELPAGAQEARHRWERMNTIRQQKLDLVLPEVMRENGIDMWITMIREANYGTLWRDLGEGYAGTDGFYVFTDRGGERIERAALGISGYRIERSGAYDLFLPADALADFVRERDPQRIGVNTSRAIGPADTLSHTGWEQIRETLGEPWASRLVSAEKLVSDFRSRRVASEIAAFAEAGEISREIAERAFSNEVITPGVTSLEDVAWWISDQLLARGLDSSFGMPSIYVTGAEGIVATSNERIIQRGDLLMIDWGVGFLNLYTDMKRIAYVLREGETEAPAGFQHAFERARAARAVVVDSIVPGITAAEAERRIYANLEEAGFRRIDFNQPTDDPESTDVVIGCHSVGNSGHGIGPSIAFFNPVRLQYELRPTNLLSIELFAYTAAPELGGAKVRIPLEDDAVVTERGVEWLYPPIDRILLIR
ncbi:MAG TPA: M24 family metallopeptidase [Thermoanaerobaculia bacterium]|nr:M24 family metallopeptidase [Thermoanaerobaculia bacterium]